MKKLVHTKKQLKYKREKLRKSLTPAEAYLWKHLKARKFESRRFTRQHSILNYIVDFYCAQEGLIVELDGEVHNNPTSEEYDSKRTENIKKLGLKVLRFENRMVFENLASVFQEIKNNFKN